MKAVCEDDFLTWSVKTQNILKENFLNNKSNLTQMIRDAIENPSLRTKFESHRLLDYLVIYEDEFDNRIRLHISTQDHLTRMHDHRFDFSTLILTGGYEHLFYKTIVDPYCVSKVGEAMHYQDEKNVDPGFMNYTEKDLFYLSAYRTEYPNNCYSISNNIVHSVFTSLNTVSVVYRSGAKKERSFIFDKASNTMWWRFGRKDESENRVQSKIMSDRKLGEILVALESIRLINKINL